MPHSDVRADTASVDTLDAERFAENLQQSYQRLWLVAAGILGDQHHAEDVVQDAAVVGLRQLDQFQPGTNFEAWMATIVRFQAFNRSRKCVRRRTNAVDPTTLDLPANENTPATIALKSDARLPSDQAVFDDAVMRALNDIGEIPRACLLLRILQDLSYAEIADLLDITEATATSHVHRTKTKLRNRLANHANNPQPSKKQ